jgi:hypothetical protein
MYRFSTACLAAILFISLAAISSAQPVGLTATITNDAEVHDVIPTTMTGDPRPASFGNATFMLNDARTELTFTAEIFNIDVTGSQSADPNDNLSAAHIHASETVTPSTTGGVVWGFFGSPQNDTNPNDQMVTPFATGVGGVFSGKWDMAEGNNTTLTAQIDNLLNGRAYINFHTSQFGAGEIRGNIAVIPEPATGVIAACCVGLALLVVRRRNRAG